MAVAKRNLEEIGESLENMGMNDRPSLLNTEMAKAKRIKIYLKVVAREKVTGLQRKDALERVWLHILTRKNSFS